MRTSAVLIVRNEAACLARCLGSLAGAVDEIVVADTGSTDATARIAEENGARLSSFPWCDDFSAARNFALDQAQGEVILTIDADEYLVTPPSDARAALDLFAQAASAAPALGLVEIVNLRAEGDDTPPAIDHTARVFLRRDFHYDGTIHEQPMANAGVAARAIEMGLTLHHTGYALSQAQAAAKAHRNIAMLRRELDAHPDDEYFRYQLGKAWASLGRHQAAAIAFEQALRTIDFTRQPPQGRLGSVGRQVLTGLVCGAAYALMNSGELPRAMALLKQHESLAHEGTRRADFFHALGYALLQLGKLDEAEAAYRLALGLPENVQGTGSWSCWYHLGLLDEARGDPTSARQKYREALRLKLDYAPALQRLRELAM